MEDEVAVRRAELRDAGALLALQRDWASYRVEVSASHTIGLAVNPSMLVGARAVQLPGRPEHPAVLPLPTARTRDLPGRHWLVPYVHFYNDHLQRPSGSFIASVQSTNQSLVRNNVLTRNS